VEGLFYSNSLLYIGDKMGGLRIASVADPTHSEEVGFYNTPAILHALSELPESLQLDDIDSRVGQ